jgi:hypothetical protein
VFLINPNKTRRNPMIKINKQAKRVLDQLTQDLKEPGNRREINNAPSFMSVHVEHIGQCDLGPMFSVAHYYQQNGDLMKDPDMVFLRDEAGDYFPIEFQQDPIIYQRVVEWDGRGGVKGYNLKLQKDLASFAGMWMRNIKQQQSL